MWKEKYKHETLSKISGPKVNILIDPHYNSSNETLYNLNSTSDQEKKKKNKTHVSANVLDCVNELLTL